MYFDDSQTQLFLLSRAAEWLTARSGALLVSYEASDGEHDDEENAQRGRNDDRRSTSRSRSRSRPRSASGNKFVSTTFDALHEWHPTVGLQNLQNMNNSESNSQLKTMRGLRQHAERVVNARMLEMAPDRRSRIMRKEPDFTRCNRGRLFKAACAVAVKRVGGECSRE